MNTIRRFLSLLMLAALIGCASPEQAAYRTIGTLTVSVDAAMNGWGDAVRTGHTTPAEEAKVRAAYEQYQSAMRLAKVVAITAKTQPDSATALETSMLSVQNASGSLIAIIQSYLK